MLRVLDDRERELVFLRPPQRIVSLVPSDTFSVFALGAGERLVGRTRFCLEPRGSVERAAVIGGTKDVDVEAVRALAPDLVIANQEENARPQVSALIQAGVPVYLCFPKTVAEGLNHLAKLARILGVEREQGPRELIKRGLREVQAAEEANRVRPPLRAFVPIWREPLMTASGDTFITDALRLAGGENVFQNRKRLYPLAAEFGKADPLSPEEVGQRDTRYPRISEAELVARKPELMLLPDEPHPFDESDRARLAVLDTPAGRAGRVRLCNGKDLMWYGAWSVEGLPRLRALVESLR
jgi:ABC-type Fe3+-hydroxamate transport system substrate-binding protein